jgi:hypothetical protein
MKNFFETFSFLTIIVFPCFALGQTIAVPDLAPQTCETFIQQGVCSHPSCAPTTVRCAGVGPGDFSGLMFSAWLNPSQWVAPPDEGNWYLQGPYSIQVCNVTSLAKAATSLTFSCQIQ